MDKYLKKPLEGMFRISSCVPEVRPGDVEGNIRSIIELAREAETKGVQLSIFPELSISGYTCADLFHDKYLLDACENGVGMLMEASIRCNTAIIVGVPLRRNGKLYNCTVVINQGHLIGVVPKVHLPNYNEFYEKRWFSSGYGMDAAVDSIRVGDSDYPFGSNQIFEIDGARVGVEICEDLWVPDPPSSKLCMAGAEVICNLSASDTLIGKYDYLLDLLRNQSARCRCAYAYSSAGFGESSTDLAFVGNAIIAENGRILRRSDRFCIDPMTVVADVDLDNIRHDRMHFSSFAEHMPEWNACKLSETTTPNATTKTDALEYRDIDPTPFVDKNRENMNRRCDEISSIQAWGLATRLKAINCRHAVIGISGGLDSTLALLVTVKAFDMLGYDRKGIIGITMPGFGTTKRTRSNADALMECLGVTHRVIPIAAAVNQHFKDIGQNPDNHDITYENSQARERTKILMDVANKENALVIGTGDLSELALGWCTYNGDQMSMYGVNASIPKTMVRYLVDGYARQSDNPELKRILHDIIDTPISPELLPASDKGEILQKTEDTVGPYELHDFFLYHMMRYGSDPRKIGKMACKAFRGEYDPGTIYKWLKTFYKRFFSQQFKRSCMPDGVKVGSICLSPRGDWRMPSDAAVRLWASEIEELSNDNNK